MPRNVWRSSHVLAGISMFFLKNLFLFFCGWLSVTYRCSHEKRHYEAKFAG